MIEICALASGSNGNSYYIGNQDEAILVDAGISARQLMQRMQNRGLDFRKIKAVFLSHEHSDHSRGIQVLSKRLGVNIWISKQTYYALPPSFRPLWVRIFEPGETIQVGSFNIHTFLKNHDGVDPCSFRIEHKEGSIGVFTDIGEPCERVKDALQKCDAIFIEANYDEKMLWEGSYPWYLKKRIASAVGHLSNRQALELIQQHAPEMLKCIFLSHLSQENNTPALAFSTFESLRNLIDVKLTSRFEAGEVYKI